MLGTPRQAASAAGEHRRSPARFQDDAAREGAAPPGAMFFEEPARTHGLSAYAHVMRARRFHRPFGCEKSTYIHMLLYIKAAKESMKRLSDTCSLPVPYGGKNLY